MTTESANNPFEVVSAEHIDGQRVAAEFVAQYTEYFKIAAFSHTIVWGSRGSGKSMHFRFLEPTAQAWNPVRSFDGDVESYLNSDGAFFGVYINCREGLLNREELRRVAGLQNANPEFLHVLFSRYMASVILLKLCATIKAQYSSIESKEIATVPQELHFLSSFIKSKESSSTTLGDLLFALTTCCGEFVNQLGKIVDRHFISDPHSPAKNDFPEDSPHLIPDVNCIIDRIRDFAGIKGPVFLLFDEANELSDLQQKCVNSLIARRSQRSLCIKVASQRHGYRTGHSLEGTIDETHDYTSLDLDALYTSHSEAYYGRVLAIANSRLERSGMKPDIRTFLPNNERDGKSLEMARQIAESRYDSLPIDKRPVDKINYIKKYAPAIVFQEVLSPKARKSYAGFDNIVHLSSGIVRSFLDCCSRMYNRSLQKNPNIRPDVISLSIQDAVIKDYSDDFIESQIVNKINELDSSSTERKDLVALYNLLIGLGKFFRKRLMDKDSREPRIISISLKDRPSPFLKRILDIAEREAFLHHKWYRSKRGDQNLECYVLNRRLCPHFNLDITGFQGRVEVTSDVLELSLESPSEFVKRMSTKTDRKIPDDHTEIPEDTFLFEW